MSILLLIINVITLAVATVVFGIVIVSAIDVWKEENLTNWLLLMCILFTAFCTIVDSIASLVYLVFAK